MTDKETNQLKKIEDVLASISDRMVQDLTSIISGNYGLYEEHTEKEIAFLDFEINADGYAVSLYPIDEDWTQLGYKKLLEEFPNGFMRDNHLDLDLDDYDFENSSDMERMDAFYSELESTFMTWFIDCWDKAGGKEAKHDFYLAQHDSNSFFNLKTKQWVDAEDK